MDDNSIGKWQTDAGNMSNYSDFDNLVYRNGIIDEFLKDNSNKHFIIAGKGVGKTLLLSYKRYLLEKRHSEVANRPSIIFIPKDRPYIDYIDSIKITLSKAHISRLKDWEYCKRLWTLIFELSSISFSYSTNDISIFLETLPPRAERHAKTLSSLIRTSRTTEYIFNEVLSMGETDMVRFVDDISNIVGEAFKNIHKGIYFFFDRIDQALESSHDDIWISIQVGLLEAAWDIMRNNHHIKIFLSIRQEAYAAHTSQNRLAISGEVSVINYTEIELKELLDKLVFFYERYENFESFIGRRFFQNTTIRRKENVFSFMNRYSIGRPRDFVFFCNQLSSVIRGKYRNDREKGKVLKNTIIKVSANSIVKNIHDEVRMLLKTLDTIEKLQKFVILFNCNILTFREMQEICRKFNEFDCDLNCISCYTSNHPFCDLFNMGLLGKIIIDPANSHKIQKFKSPYDNMVFGLRDNSEFHLIHPALRNYINDLHAATPKGISYRLLDDLLIGDGLPWNEKMSKVTKINKHILHLKDERAKAFFRKEQHDFAFRVPYIFPLDKARQACKNCSANEKAVVDDIIKIFDDKGSIVMEKPSIFVSYAWENEDHKLKVESFTDMLRKKGFDAVMDSTLKLKYPDLDQMMSIGLARDKIIIVLSENYKKKADNHEGGVWVEFKMIADELENNHQKFIFVCFEPFSSDLKKKISPRRIGNRYILDLNRGKNDDYNELVAFITNESEIDFSSVKTIQQTVNKRTIQPF